MLAPTPRKLVGTRERRTLQKILKGIDSDATPIFANVQLNDLTATRLVATSSSKTLASVSDLTAWVAASGGASVADDGDGTITITLSGGLDDIADLTPDDSTFIVGDGANWVAESGNTVRNSLSLGAADDVTFGSLTIATVDTLPDPVVVGKIIRLSTDGELYLGK